ncbi:hypothetical protein NIES4074_03170 [Cylindrospermum sp. NIES-4074]|nr:hypothetical protein NIES4074_03170 [Cylindrospermum sp. NIES-4074]
MLKPLLLSGWFRVQPFAKYCVALTLIAPLVGPSSNAISANRLEVAKIASGAGESDSIPKKIATNGEPNLKANQVHSWREESVSMPVEMAKIGGSQVLPADQIKPLTGEDNSQDRSNVADSPATSQVAPLAEMPASQSDLIQKLKDAKIKSLQGNNLSLSSKDVVLPLATSKVAPILKESQPTSVQEIPTGGQIDESQTAADPIGSPHPIPWKWILVTQETVGGNGGSGVRHYRSVPVVSPDRKYAVYSRVQLEVKPEMYNSRVSSVLFVQDMQTKRLRVMATTSAVSDPLLQASVESAEQPDTNGTIGVLVPVSWSEKGDRFLARRFEGIFNTADSTDQAVIWDRQQNNINTVAPAQEESDHEKISILLGWSKNQPDHVLFRTGELGDEDWPLVKVSSDGKTVNVTTDQPITFGERVTPVWGEPQVASR